MTNTATASVQERTSGDDGPPEVSVVVPTRNRADFLPLALRSARRQRRVNFEVIVVDDGSTDATPEVVAGLADSRIRVIRNDTSLGVSVARNRGIDEARGAWVAFLDDDDLWAPEKLSLQLQAVRDTSRSWAYVGSVNITAANRVVGGAPPLPPDQVVSELKVSNVVPGGCSGVLASRALLLRAGAFDSRLQPLADWDLWLRLVQTGPPAWVPRPLVAYRLHGGNLSLNAARIQGEFDEVARRHGVGNRALLDRYLGTWSLRVRKRREAIRYFLRGAMRRDPRYPLAEVVTDLGYFGRTVVDDVARRLGWHGPRTTPRRSQRQASWTAEGQHWIDELVAAGDGTSQLP